ncbi:MAG: radical SAM protein [Alphaproteobacteria bacterium]
MYSFRQKIRHLMRHSSLVLGRPWVLKKVLEGYWRTRVLHRTVLRTLELAVTPACNTQCEMCYASRLHQPGQSILTPQEYRDIWRQAKKLGAFSVIISGGEPTVRPDLMDVIDAVEPKKSLIAVVSNGIQTADFVERFVAAGVTTLHLSLDGTDPATHDAVRRHKGNFAKTLAAIDKAKALGMNVYISTVIFRGGLAKMDDMVAFAAAHGIGIVFSLACPTGEKAGDESYVITPAEWQAVQKKMSANPHIRSDWTINLSGRVECPGGREKVAISPYGEVTGCGMNFVSFGNVRHEPLETIWRRMQRFPHFARRSPDCLIGADPQYIRDYLMPLAGCEHLPVRLPDHPAHAMPLGELDEK